MNSTTGNIITGTQREVLNDLAATQQDYCSDYRDLFLEDRSSSCGTEIKYEVLGPAKAGERQVIGELWLEQTLSPHERALHEITLADRRWRAQLA